MKKIGQYLVAVLAACVWGGGVVLAQTPVNLALSATASSQSSHYDTAHNHLNVRDGLATGEDYWESHRHTTNSPPTSDEWVTIDLGSAQAVAKVTLIWTSDKYATGFKIEYSNDNTTWTTLTGTGPCDTTVSLAGDGGTDECVPSSAVTARYWRMYQTARYNLARGVGLYEMELWNSVPLPPGNQAPSCAIATSNIVDTELGSIRLNVTATDSDGTIQYVKFYRKINGGTATNFGTDYAYAYYTIQSNLVAASYEYWAVCRDDDNADTESSHVFLTVASANVAPTVSVQTANQPVGGWVAPAAVHVTATAADSDGTVASVAFFLDGAAAGTDSVSPFALTLPAVAAGDHSVYAIATDDDGATTQSSTVPFTVAAPPAIPADTLPVGQRLRLLTWNVNQGRNASNTTDVVTQVELLADLMPDVLVLQEALAAQVEDFESGLETLTGRAWHACVAAEPSSGFVNVILSTFGFGTSCSTGAIGTDRQIGSVAWTDTSGRTWNLATVQTSGSTQTAAVVTYLGGLAGNTIVAGHFPVDALSLTGFSDALTGINTVKGKPLNYYGDTLYTVNSHRYDYVQVSSSLLRPEEYLYVHTSASDVFPTGLDFIILQ